MKIRSLAAPVLAAALLASCADMSLSIVCPSVPVPALAISVLDGQGERSLAPEARGWYQVGTQRDSLRYRSGQFGDFLVANGPAGVYTVEVNVAGHAPWTGSAAVQSDACGPATVRLTASPERLDDAT